MRKSTHLMSRSLVTAGKAAKVCQQRSLEVRHSSRRGERCIL